MHLLISLLAFISLSHAAVPNSLWKEVEAPGVEKMWQLSTAKDTFISLFKDESEYKLEDFDASSYVSSVPEIREFMNTLMGIKGYKISKSSSERTSDSWIVKLEGSYLRRGEVSVDFCEIHQFTSSTFTQKQLLYPSAYSSTVLASQGCFDLIGKVIE